MSLRLLTAIFLISLAFKPSDQPEEGIHFRFKNRPVALNYGMHRGPLTYFPRSFATNEELDTLSNWYRPAKNYVEIIRQDDPLRPTIGMALGFEFDEENEGYPFSPARVVMQVKNFGWGGVEFSTRDTMNFTGVSNDISNDMMLEVDGYENDTIWGRFSGLLLSGAGPMASIDSGWFKVRVYRVK